MARIATGEQMRRLIGLWRASGQTKAEFVRAHGVSRGKLEYWCRRLGEPRAGRRGRRRHSLSFIPVQVTDPAAGSGGEIEILLATGDRVRVSAEVPTEALGRVIDVLRRGC